MAISEDPDIALGNIDPLNPLQVVISTPIGSPPGITKIIVYEPNSGLTVAIGVSAN